jgi:hypothetical protein
MLTGMCSQGGGLFSLDRMSSEAGQLTWRSTGSPGIVG